jgi:hypothetical protein
MRGGRIGGRMHLANRSSSPCRPAPSRRIGRCARPALRRRQVILLTVLLGMIVVAEGFGRVPRVAFGLPFQSSAHPGNPTRRW